MSGVWDDVWGLWHRRRHFLLATGIADCGRPGAADRLAGETAAEKIGDCREASISMVFSRFDVVADLFEDHFRV